MSQPVLSSQPTQILHLVRKLIYNFSLISLRVSVQGRSFQFQYGFSLPKNLFGLRPPTYQQVTNLIRKMKSSASPGPLDQVSIICFKHCPYLRSYVTSIIHSIWISHTAPSTWKKACTIVIHKNGDINGPSNFRPITLQSVCNENIYIMLTKRNLQALSENNYIEHKIQEGFTQTISGSLEHTTQMSSII